MFVYIRVLVGMLVRVHALTPAGMDMLMLMLASRIVGSVLMRVPPRRLFVPCGVPVLAMRLLFMH